LARRHRIGSCFGNGIIHDWSPYQSHHPSDVASMLTRPRYADRFVITGPALLPDGTDPDVGQQTTPIFTVLFST